MRNIINCASRKFNNQSEATTEERIVTELGMPLDSYRIE